MAKLNEHTTKRTKIYEGKIVDLELHDVQLPDGREGMREVIKHPGAVAILAVDEEGKIVLVNQFRKPLDKVIAELPAGKLEINEDPLVCAKRELAEETGYRANEWSFVTSFYTSPGFADEIIYLYLAKDLEMGTVATDDDEFVDPFVVSIEEAEGMLAESKIHDAKTAYALLYAKCVLSS
ncbi:NUDIX domain-containing protein [Texcoconibacillus texcoconensis]|uniref:ADP-ribose pyrophosphatase n=1 Tax=Texcoconibacillus texcoconensis TaxID=1095777 RepID=A0A840QNS9_9BACI|nr:NUDIX hydrolase [Texcoconibacillus texcoconensis]MBB5172993.1 ADP-ribose pyrophosphatase [Texcoconibacillus texcoconensis]